MHRPITVMLAMLAASTGAYAANPTAATSLQTSVTPVPSGTQAATQQTSLFGGSPSAALQPPASHEAARADTSALQPPQAFDYSANANSEVFGAQLFTGSFARPGATQFNPDYLIATGDRLQVRIWGGFTFDTVLAVDPQGNIFLPHVGPVKVLGVRNQDLQKSVDVAVRRVFRSNVFSYASLAAAQPVRVFVGGFVHRPGLYNGTSMDSLLHYLDQAGGIDPERGSFLEVQVKRGEQVRSTVNLYDFLLDGRIPLLQLGDGDVIFTNSTIAGRSRESSEN